MTKNYQYVCIHSGRSRNATDGDVLYRDLELAYQADKRQLSMVML